MNHSRHFILLGVAAITALIAPGFAQDAQTSQAEPAISGTGQGGHIAVWKNSTTLGSAAIIQSGSSIGIGTKTPAATLEVNGSAQVDGNFSLSGNILENGGLQLIWAPNDASNNLSVGLASLNLSCCLGLTDNTVVGDGAMGASSVTDTSSQNTAIGSYAMHEASGGANTAIGYGAGYFFAGGYNTAVGTNAMKPTLPTVNTGNNNMDLSRFLRQPVKTQFSLNGKLCHGVVTTNLHT